MQIPPRWETRLVTEGKDAADWHTRSIATCFHLSLLADVRVELSLCWFNFGPPNPAKLKQSLLSQEMITDGSLPRNAPLRLPQSANDSAACTPLTSQRLANHYSASPSVTSNTQIGRSPRMSKSHNQHAQSPIR